MKPLPDIEEVVEILISHEYDRTYQRAEAITKLFQQHFAEWLMQRKDGQAAYLVQNHKIKE